MKKSLIVVGLVVVALVALGVAGLAFAQGQDPATPSPWGQGMMRGGRMGGMMGGWGSQGWGSQGRGMMGNGSYGPMHTDMVGALAGALNLSVEDVQARMEAGETAWDIALSTGLAEEEVPAVLQAAHVQALDAAVAAGTLTQEQADWMKSRMESRWQNGAGGGYGPCHGGNAVPGNTGGRGGRGMRWSQGA